MTTLLASLLGFFTSFLPAIIKLWQDKSDKQHELAILQLQMQNAQADRDVHREEIGVYADIAESQALYQTYNTGVGWVDALNGTVRPIITYAFFFEYVLIKYLQYTMIGDHAPLFQYLDILWTQEDQAIFAGIISFYFGQRAISKRLAK